MLGHHEVTISQEGSAEGRDLAGAADVRPKLLTAATAMLGLLPLLVLPFHGTEIERPLAITMVGGLITSTLFTLLARRRSIFIVHQLQERLERRRGATNSRPSERAEAP